MKKFLFFLGIGMSAGFLKAEAQNLTWSQDIAPILYTNCTKCHNPNGSAPFSLIQYADAYNNRLNIQYMVSNRLMPPWPPDPTYRHFAQERLLSQTDMDKISDWVNQNAPQGDPNLAPPPPSYPAGGDMTSPDFTGQIPTYTVNTSADLYRCFVLPTGISSDKYITEIELIPGNRPIVHHVLIFKDNTNTPNNLDAADPDPGYTNYGGTGSNASTLIGAWVPGQGVYKLPAGMGIKMTPSDKIVLQIHYPGGITNELDSSEIKLKWTNSPQREVSFAPPLNHFGLDNGPLLILANQTKTFTAQYTVPLAVSVLSVAPHMHLIGRKIKSWGITTSNDTIPLINIKDWNFNWQGSYNFRNVLKIPAGTVLHSEATYDNTAANPFNPNNPPQAVFLGEGTEDEMMLIYFAYTLYFNGDENIVIDSSEVINVGIDEPGTELIAVTPQLYDPVPNPATDQVKVTFYLPGNESINIRLLDINGRVISAPIQNQSFMAGINFLTLPLQDLSKGLYFIQLDDGKTQRSKKLIIE